MATCTFADDKKRLLDLTALYEHGDKFSECIEECERTLREHTGMPPYWRIKIYCILVGATEDWGEAEEWRQAGEAVWWTEMTMMREGDESPPWMKDARGCLDDLYAYRAQDAPSWSQAKEELDRWIHERELRVRLRCARLTLTSTGEEDEDEDEDSNVEEQAAAQLEVTNYEAAEEAAAIQEPAEIGKMNGEKTQPSAEEAVGGAKKQSVRNKTKDRMAKTVSKIVDKMQSAVDMATRLESRASG